MKRIQYYILLFFLISSGYLIKAAAQLHDVGGMAALSLAKDFGRSASVDLEQEFRFDDSFSSFKRSTTSAGLSYTLIRDLLKASAGYDLQYRNEDNFYEMRHRFSLALNAERKYMRYDFKFRTRMQSTYRDENIGDYKFNPKYVWRNKAEVEYSFFQLPLKPYLSGELLCPINSKHGFFADEYRITLGAKYRVSRRNYLDLWLRFDQEIQQVAPENILYIGVGWKYKL